jgi:hypothetical protein
MRPSAVPPGSAGSEMPQDRRAQVPSGVETVALVVQPALADVVPIVHVGITMPAPCGVPASDAGEAPNVLAVRLPAPDVTTGTRTGESAGEARGLR